MPRRGTATLSRRAGLLLALALASLAALGAEGGSSPAAALSHPPPIQLLSRVRGNARSSNWSGYAVAGADFTDVKGSWVQPSVTCRGGVSASSFWVGLDGYKSAAVEQIGTDADCNPGGATHYAWLEMYPDVSMTVRSVPVRPGDSISAEVSATGNTFTLSIRNASTGASFATTRQSSAPRTSAEWVVEAPSACLLAFCRMLPLASFTTASFSGASAQAQGTAGPISAFHPDSITMASRSGTVKAQPSGLSGGGAAFSVAWRHA